MPLARQLGNVHISPGKRFSSDRHGLPALARRDQFTGEMSKMFASSRIRALTVPALVLGALTLALPGCEEDTKPKITKFTATPQCDVIKTVTKVNIDPADSSIVSIDTLGTWMEVKFFARAASGNELGDPTGANSPLEWKWTFGDGGTASNEVGPIHRYTQPSGPDGYLVTLSVKDDDGDEDTASLRVLVGEAYTDLDILSVDVDPIPTLTFKSLAGSVATNLSQTWGDQYGVDKMPMKFDGTLVSSCTISGLFEQYLWNWVLIEAAANDTTRIVDLDPAGKTYNPSYRQIAASLDVTEAVTGINRAAEASTLNPVGVRVGYTTPRSTVPGVSDPLVLDGYLLGGVKQMRFVLEWDPAAATLEQISFDPAVQTAFTASSEALEPGRVAITLTSPAGYAGTETQTRIGTADFVTRSAQPALYPVRVREPFALRDGDPESGAPFSTRDGGIRLDSDCDGDEIPDSFQAEFFPAAFDCNGNGIHDTCDIETGTSEDANENGVPDECES